MHASSFLLQVLCTYSEEFSASRSSPVSWLHISQDSRQIPSLCTCPPWLPSVKQLSLPLRLPSVSVPILCLIFFYGFDHNLKLYYLLSLCTCVFVCLSHKTMCSTWWGVCLIYHCTPLPRLVPDTWQVLKSAECSIHEGECLQPCPCSHSWQGEICLCTSRIFVQKSIYTEFLKRFVEATRKWKVGIPSDPLASMGPLISKAHLEKVSKFLPCKL